MEQRSIVLLGASGLIGSALAKKNGNTIPLRTVPWSENPQIPVTLAKSLDAGRRVDVILACGVTDPRLPEARIRYSNTEFPRELISACLRQPQIRFVTLGTVMENFPEACAANPYLKSKLDLGHWIQSLAEQPHAAGRFRHLRLHTIYGGDRSLVKSHMFLGQILGALETDSEFRMSSGDQLREYHHVDDIAEAILHIVSQEWEPTATPLVGIHSGNPVRLADLARAIFREFEKEPLLKVGSLPRAPGENLGQSFDRSPHSVLPVTRDPITGVVQWIKEILAARSR